MNTSKTKRLVDQNQVVALKADMTGDAPEAEKLLVELGNSARTIPYLAIFPGNGGEPIVMDGPITQSGFLANLERAGPSKGVALANLEGGRVK